MVALFGKGWNWLQFKFWPICGFAFINGALLSLPVWIATLISTGGSKSTTKTLSTIAYSVWWGPLGIWLALCSLFLVLTIIGGIWYFSYEELFPSKAKKGS